MTEITYNTELFPERSRCEDFRPKSKCILWHKKSENEQTVMLKIALKARKRASAVVRLLSVETEISLQERFIEQAEKWERETAHLSSPLQRMMHPSYQAILGMGAGQKLQVVQLMLSDMQKNHRDWLLALSYLTQANPIDPKDAGKTDKLISAWLRWGSQQGLI